MTLPLQKLSTRVGHFRWLICTLLLLGTTKNYMDRQVLGVLKTTLQHQFGWGEIDYSNLVFAFQAAYAAGLLILGRLVDWLWLRPRGGRGAEAGIGEARERRQIKWSDSTSLWIRQRRGGTQFRSKATCAG